MRDHGTAGKNRTGTECKRKQGNEEGRKEKAKRNKKRTEGSDSGNNADDSLQITAPQTGDNSHPMLWVTLLAASLAGLLALLSVRRKKDEE